MMTMTRVEQIMYTYRTVWLVSGSCCTTLVVHVAGRGCPQLVQVGLMSCWE